MDVAASKPTVMQRALDGVERLGNKVPHPVMMFLYLIGFIIILSQVLAWFDVSATELIAEPVPVQSQPNYYEDTTQHQLNPYYDGGEQLDDPHFELKEVTIPIVGFFTVDGIRYLFTSFVTNFQNFGVIGVTFIAMLGAGAAEGAGLMGALIRKLVASAPKGLITFLIILVGALSSVASDAGYLILIPLAAAAFLAVGRHPIAGLAAGFAGVAATFAVNIIPQPIDAMMVEVANESIALAGGSSISVVSNYYFSVVSMIFLCIVATIITERMIEPRLGKYDPSEGSGEAVEAAQTDEEKAAEAKGLRYALFGFLGVLVIVLAATIPHGAPLRDPDSGAIIGTTPFMDSLLFVMMIFFLVSGIAYGICPATVKSSNDVITAITKTFNGLGGLIFMLLMIAQFI